MFWYIIFSLGITAKFQLLLFLGDPIFTQFWVDKSYLSMDSHAPAVPTLPSHWKGFAVCPGRSLRVCPLCELSDGRWAGTSCWRPSRTGDTRTVSLPYGFAGVTSEWTAGWTFCRTRYIRRASPLCESSCVWWAASSGWRTSRIRCTRTASLLCEFSDVWWGLISWRRFWHTRYTHRAAPLYEFSGVS